MNQTLPISAAAAALVLFGGIPARAATSGSGVFEASHFARYQPRTALDIAQRVPGFALELGDNDVRGFGQAAGNVVINGARPSAKSESLQAMLARIPAGRVTRVEVAPGSRFGADYATKAQVLNVVLGTAGGIDGSVTASARRVWNGDVNPNLSASAVIRTGASTFNLAAGSNRELQVEEGTDRLISPAGAEIEHRRKVNRIKPRNPSVSASWALERGQSDAIRLNARYSPGRFDLTQANHVTPAAGAERDDDLVQRFRNPLFEVGGDVTRPLGGGAIKLVGLATRRKRDDVERYRFRRDGETLGGFEQNVDAHRDETIGRLTWSHGDLAGMNVEAGGEIALNRLDSKVAFYSLSAGDQRTRINLPIDDATVEELRGEVFAKAGTKLTDSLRADVGLNYELSDLSVRGDARADRRLAFLKPSVTLDWRGGDWHGQASLRRRVAQLDFNDFVSAAELASDRVSGGNAELEPQRSWEARALIERPILGQGLARVEIGFDKVSKLQDRILTEDGFDAPGNLGTGMRKLISASIDAPLDSLGLAGARVKLSGQLQRTRVEDPISGENRRWSGFFPNWEWRAELRRDVGAFSYGLTVQDRDRIRFFRGTEIDTNFNSGPFGTAFVEYRPSAATSITFDVDNALETGGRRERVFYSPNRSAGTPSATELRERNSHRRFGLTIKQSFGAGKGG